jgi:DNA replication protein DnaC
VIAKSDPIARAKWAQDRIDAEEQRAAEVEATAKELWNIRGSRYQDCRLSNFDATVKAQHQVLAELWEYVRRMQQLVQEGAGVILIGPPGTGKDHLLAGLMHEALAAGVIVKWTSGLGLFRRSRDAIDAQASEADQLRAYTKPQVLAISDPTWEREPLTRWEKQRLGEIVDERQNNLRPTWITINAESRQDAERMMGHAVVDRLGHGALSLACNWGSYRRSLASLLS